MQSSSPPDTPSIAQNPRSYRPGPIPVPKPRCLSSTTETGPIPYAYFPSHSCTSPTDTSSTSLTQSHSCTSRLCRHCMSLHPNSACIFRRIHTLSPMTTRGKELSESSYYTKGRQQIQSRSRYTIYHPTHFFRSYMACYRI